MKLIISKHKVNDAIELIEFDEASNNYVASRIKGYGHPKQYITSQVISAYSAQHANERLQDAKKIKKSHGAWNQMPDWILI